MDRRRLRRICTSAIAAKLVHCISLILVFTAVVTAEFFSPGDVPGPPEKVFVSPASDSSMRVQFFPPLNVKPEGVNGAPVLGYKVELARRVDEVQTFSVAASGPILSGFYKLQLGVETTSCIPWNASDVELEMALEELPTVDSVGVSRSAYSAAKNGYVYTVTFDGAYLENGKQTNTLDGDATDCPGTQPPNRVLSFEGGRVTTGVPGFYPEVWQVVSTNTGTQMLGGTFDLSVGFEGHWVQTSQAIKVSVAAGSRTATTRSSMLGVVNRGDRVRVAGEEFTVHATAPFTDSELPLDSYHVRGTPGDVFIEIMDTALGDVHVKKTSTDVFTSSDFSTRLAAGEQVRIGSQDVEVASVIGNTITLVNAWTGTSALHVTAYARKKATFSANAEAADMKRVLGALPGVGAIDVSRVGPTKLNGYRWYVTFQSVDSGNCPASPCLRVSKKPGTTKFVDVYGADCTTCTVTPSIVQDDSLKKTLYAMKGDFAATTIVSSQEVGGVVAEVQSISTKATADDISGSFAVSFQTLDGVLINFDDTAVDLRTKLQSLATVGRVNVTRVDNSDFGVTWTITFLSNVGDLPLLAVVDETLLKGTGVNVVVQELVKGVDAAFETIIEGLVPGQEYSVRAYARNENGYGTSTAELQQRGRGALPLFSAVATSPEAPGVTGMWPLSGSQMELRLSSPVDHGDPVSKYLFEYVVGDTFGKPAIKKVFVYNSLANDIAGTFRVQYGDDVSSTLSVHSTATTLESALNSLPSLRPVSVTRALCVLTGQEDISFSEANNRLTTTTPLTASQSNLLLKGVRIDVGGAKFTVRVQPAEGSSDIDVELGHGQQDFKKKWAVLKLDSSGRELGPYGYEWTILFGNVVEDIVDSKYPGLQVLSSLTSVKTGSATGITYGINAFKDAIPAEHYGYFEINNDERVCDTYVVGAPSSVQVVRLFGPTTATGGTFALKLGSETTDCISLGKTGAASTIQDELLDVISKVSKAFKVTVEEVRAFKVTLLTGSWASKVTDYDNTGKLTVASALTQTQVDVLPKYAIIQVSRNPNDFSRHSCEFTVTSPPAQGTTTISVSPAGSCDFFSGEARSLKILDFHDYNVRFWGHYPTGEWPTLQFDSASFGAASCAPWVPSLTNLPVYGQVHTVKYEGSCSKGQAGIQTILADASSTIGGTFTLSYMGEVTSPLSFKDTGAAEMRDAIDLITARGTVNVGVSQYGIYGKAWHVTFVQEDDDQDSIFIQHARLTGQNALISVYPTVTVFTDAKQDDISGSFRISFGGETTEAIGFSATHMKVTQELQKLSVVDSVLALGGKTAGDVGVYSLELTADAVGGSQVLSNIRLGGVAIDPTRFLAIGETLGIATDTAARTIQSMTPVDITLTQAFGGTAAGTTAQNLDVSAGLITKQIKPLPGYVGFTRLAQVIAVSKNSNEFELPADHGIETGDYFFVGSTRFMANIVLGTKITTNGPYTGENVVAASPEVYLFDDKLQTTEDLTNLVTGNDDLWLPSVSADMNKYTIKANNSRYLTVESGTFSDRIVRTRAYHISNGRKWNLVFRSYDGSLDTIDAIPDHDWRGTEARIGTRSPKAIAPNVINVGNPAPIQTILLEVTDTTLAATYTLSFVGETTAAISCNAINTDIEKELEKLESVNGVTVNSLVSSGTTILTISFWGVYPMKKLPLLEANPTTNNLKAYVRGNGAVAVTKQDNFILESSQAYAFRIFAENSKGISDSVSVFQAQTSTSSVVPTPPTGVALGEFHGPTWLSINYWAPFYSGGADVTMYRIEWDSSPNFDSSSIDYGVASIEETPEVQQVTTSYRSSVGAGGTFTLSWGSRTTAALPFDCTEAAITDALAIITETSDVAVNPVEVTKTEVSWGYAWKITFWHSPGNLAPLVADGAKLTGDFPRISVVEVEQGSHDLAIGDFTHEVQEVYTSSGSLLGGSFTLTFGSKTTGDIYASASALEMQAALQAITALYSIKVTRVVQSTLIKTAIWSVTFAYLRGEEMVGAGNIFTMAVGASQLTGTGATVRVVNKISGSDPFRFSLTGLRPGLKYYAHVMAYNSDGFGSATSPLATAVTCGQPGPPPTVTATVVDGTTLAVSWAASAMVGELCSVDKYKVEWYRAGGIQPQQTITTSAGNGLPEIQRLVNIFANSRSRAGYFKLSFGGEATQNIRWDANAVGLNSVKERLERLSTVGTVDVSKTDPNPVVGGVLVEGLLVTATATTVTRHVSSTSTITSIQLATGDIIIIAGNQRTITGVAVTGNVLTITIDQSLEAPNPVPVFESASYAEWKITFLAGHVGPQELIQASPSDSWTGSSAGIYAEAVQRGLQSISGTFTIAFASGGVSDTTPPLSHNVSAADMQIALESLITIGAVKVTRSANGYGYNWAVEFLSEFKNDVSLLSVDGTELQGPGAQILAAYTRNGEQPSFYCERDKVTGVAVEIGVPGQLRYTIPGLKTGQKYAIRVRAHNKEGYGYAASITPAFQIPRTTPTAPQAVELIFLSSRLLKVRWRAPESNGGAIITSYRIQWDTSSDFTSPASGDLRMAPTDVPPFFFNIPVSTVMKYFARVFAVNSEGDGAFGISSPSSILPSDRTPGRPEDATATVLSSYTILVEWKTSSTEKDYYGGNGGLPITQYMIEWDHSTDFDSPAAFGLVDGTKRSYIIGGDDAFTGVRSDQLTPGSSYSIRVTAFNSKGAGAPRPTVPLSVVVSNQPPGAPQNLNLSELTATSVKADWTNSLYDGGASLKSYQVEWDEQDDFSSGQSSSATIPIIREMQSVVLQSDVVNAEQFVEATVEVTNEEQVVRTTFSGVDEIQVIKTTNNAVVDEIQAVVTSATDRNEVQELRLDADDVDEIQAIRTTVPEAFEVQTIKVGVVRVSEVQTITITLPGAFADPANSIRGTLFFSFDSSICTHCVNKMYQRTDNLVPSLQSPTGETIVEAKLIALANIDEVVVTRSKNSAGPDLTYVYTVTFTGLEVAGDVPLLAIDAAVTVNNNAVSGIPTQATALPTGSEVAYASAATFTVTYTCESYSDPYAITTFSTPCTPSVRICDACVTSFDGTTFTVSQNLGASVQTGAKLIAGVCSFEAGTVTAGATTTIAVAADDAGVYCSKFTGNTFSLYRTPQISRAIPLKTAPTTISAGSVVEGLLTGAIDYVTITRKEEVDRTFVGSVYTLTFRKRSGTLPLLLCTAAGSVLCTVARTADGVGSMITGTFKVGLVSEADAALATPTPIYTASIPWDASEADMKSYLEAVTQNTKYVFGTVSVKRTVYAPKGNKWSGGFTWQITFTSRGWNIPRMVPDSSLLKSSHDPTHHIPTVSIEDAPNTRDGNEISGTMTFQFGKVLSTVACRVGLDTSLQFLDTRVRDTVLETFFKDNLKIPTTEIMRSAATQARGFTWTISFIDPSTAGDVGMLQIKSSQLTGQNYQLGVYETVKGNELGGSFQLNFNGETTDPIGFAAEASEMETKLNKLGTIRPSSVKVTRGAPTSDQVLGYTWYVTFFSSKWVDPTSDHSNGFAGNWQGSVRAAWDDVWESGYSKAWGRHVGHTFLLKCITDGLTTTSNDGSQSCSPSASTIGVGPIKGTFAVKLDSSSVATYPHMAVNAEVISYPIPHNAWATKEQSGNTGTSVEEILERMGNVGDVAVSRGDVDKASGGYEWTITFLRDVSDATTPCEQLEESAGSQLCNAPGNMPLLSFDNALLTGSNSQGTITESQAGTLLRGDFTDFRVKGDAGIAQRYSVSVICSNAVGTACTVTSFAVKSGGDLLQKQLLVQDRITVGTFTSCIFEVTGVAPSTISVKQLDCGGMDSSNTGATTWMGLSIRLSWNADESVVQRVLEAAATNSGRKVSVRRTVHGKYGEMSWRVRFISNPTFTPPGAGDLPDITTTFVPEVLYKYDVTVTQVVPGSKGLSGSFLLDFHSSSYGPREIFFDEDPDRLQRKINEMDTVGRVTVKQFKYPSKTTGCDDASCSGGWDDKPVQNAGTRAGYRWRIRFMKATGDYEGFAFPPGSGNVASLSVSVTPTFSLKGTGVSVDVLTNIPGSLPLSGTFSLNTTKRETPTLPYFSTAESMKLGIEAMDLFGEVDITRGLLVTQKIPGVTATLTQDGSSATIVGIDDIRQFIAPTDVIRFGTNSPNNLPGSNNDAPFTGAIEASRVVSTANSPIVTASNAASTRLLYPGMQLRIDGLKYQVQRTGHEIQTIAVTDVVGSWTSAYIADSFKLQMTRGGVTKPPTTCLRFNDEATNVQAALFGLLYAFDNNAKTEDVVVSRVGPITTSTRKGYVYSVYFLGDSVAGDVAPLQYTDCVGIGTVTVKIDTVTHGGKLPHQRLILATDSGQVEDSQGYYQLSLDATVYTGCIKWGASAADVETALEKTLNTDLIVTRTGSGTSQTELQRLRMTANSAITGTGDLFQVQFSLNGKTAATKCLKYGVSAEDLEVELNKLNNLGALKAVGVDHVNVTREGDGQATWGFGYEYLINFRGSISGGFSSVIGDVPLLEIGNVGQGACSAGAMKDIYPALTMETVRQGSAGFTYDIFFMDYKTTPYATTLSLKHADNPADNVCSAVKQTGGSVRKVSVETVELGGSSELQILNVLDTRVTGAYQIKLGSQSSSCLAFNEVAQDVAGALVGLTAGSAGDVLVSSDTDFIDSPYGLIYTITFVGESVTGNIPLLEAVQSSDTACANTVATTNIIVESLADGGAASGEFALTKPYDGEAPNTPHVAYTMSQQFSVMDEQFEIQQLIISNPSNNIAASAKYKLRVLGVDTVSIPWDASESVLQNALTIPTKVADGDIVVTRRTNSGVAPYGFIYTIYFSGSSVSLNVDAIQVLTPTAPDIGSTNVLLSTIRDGVVNGASLTTSSIPLALPNDPKTASQYLSSTAEKKLDIYKVNGYLWTIKFKSSLGNIPKLGKQLVALSGGAMTIFDDFIPGSTANSFVIPSLLSGINYHVHVATLTDIGIGSFTPSASIEPSGSASAVQNIDAGYALYEREVQEIRLAASHITEIQEITTEATSIPEVQTVQTYASPAVCPTGACITGSFAFRVPTVQTVTISADAAIAGTFTLLFEREVVDTTPGTFKKIGAMTAPIDWNADAGTVNTKLTTVANSALASTDIIVTRGGNASPEFGYGYVFQITFVGNDVAGETLAMTCTPSFTPSVNVNSKCTVEMNTNMAMGTDTMVQEVVVSANKPVVVGSYKLFFTHLGFEKETDCIPFDASADVMKAKLEGMSNIDRVYVTREDNAPNGFVYRIVFHGNGVSTAVNELEWKATACPKFQTLENNVLTESGVVGTVVTSIVSRKFVSADGTAAQLTSDLNRLPIFRNVLVTQSLMDDQGGYIWTVAFDESEGNIPQFICAVDANFKVGAVCKAETLTDGNVLSGNFFIGASSPIPFNANEAQIKNEIEAMTNIDTVQVTRSAPSPQLGYTWTITFVDYNGDAPPLLVTSSLEGTGSRISVREVRKGNALGGTFTLSYLNSVTAPIKWNALETTAKSSSDGSSLQEKLETLDVVGRVSVQRLGPDQDGGYSWLVTFLDNVLNSGDLPLLLGNASMLTGEGAVVFTREVTKGSNAVGDQLWLSFDPPATDNGSPITKYQVRWDTSSTFTTNPADVFITDADILYRTQRITTSAPSLAWSSNMIQPTASAVHKLTILDAGTFTLTFRGAETTTLTTGPTGASTIGNLKSALQQLSSVGPVDISSAATTLVVSAEFQITFSALPGALPLLTVNPSSSTIASVAEVQAGTTNFRKEVIVFSCLATMGTVKFTYKGKIDETIKFDAKLTEVEAELLAVIGGEADSISVSSGSSVPALTALCSTASPADITIIFHRVYGDISLRIDPGSTGSDAFITMNTDASVDGVYNDNPALTMSGTFQVGYQGLFTGPLNAGSSADQLRYALEDLDTIQTVGVVCDRSYQSLPGKVDVTEGETFVTCSAGETCNFYSAAYGLPGYFIRIGGDWYTVLADTTSPGLHKTRLYLGDLSGRETGYKGLTQLSVTVYEWTKGYEWTVDMLSVTSPLGYLRAKVPRLYPGDSTVQIYGSSCSKCYYLPTQTTKRLTMGQEYNIEVYAYNFNGKGAASEGDPVTATPSQVPSAPSNVNLAVVSGKEIEVLFSPPPLGSTNVSPNLNNAISSYIVQWDTVAVFKHGRQICAKCATKLNGLELTVSASLTSLMTGGTKFTIADQTCVLEVDTISGQLVKVKTAACVDFNGRSDSLYYYTYPPSTLSGSSIQGSPPFRYVISSLTAAKTYYVRVAAVNAVPVQQISLSGEPVNNRQWSYSLTALTADRVSDPPLSVFLNPFSASTLELQVQLSTRDGEGTGGTAITALWIDVDTVSTFDSATKIAPTEVAKSSVPELYSGGPRIYYVTGLSTGKRHFVQVKAVNSIGYSRATIAPTAQTPTRHPNGPATVKVSTLTFSSTPINSATVTWQKPADNGGLSVTSYKVEWWRSASRPEIQTIELKWVTQPTVARFKLAFGGVTMATALPMDVTAENLRFALMSLISGSNIPVGHIKVTRAAVNIVQGYQWTVTFDSTNKNAGNQPLIQFIQVPLDITGGSGVFGRVFEVQSGIALPIGNVFPGKQEVQVLVTYATVAIGGYFRLSYKGSAWTNFLAATVSAADLKLALEALPTIGVVTVNLETTLLSGNAWFGRVWTITFESNVGNLPSLIIDSSRITPTGAFVAVKDGDNAVDSTGVLSLWDATSACPAACIIALQNVRQQAAPTKSIAQLATPGEAAVEYGYYETLDASTLTYTIPNLTPGLSYLVSVSAKNAQGFGARTQSSPVSVIPPLQVPGPPVNVSVDVNPGASTQLLATWAVPASDGGSPVWMYRVEYDVSSLFTDREQQEEWCPVALTPAIWKIQSKLLTGTSSISSGYFKLKLTGKNAVEVSDPIPWNAVALAKDEASSVTASASGVFCTTASPTCTSSSTFPFDQLEKSGSIQSKLGQFSLLTKGIDVTRSTPAADGSYTWMVTFLDGGQDFSLSVVDMNLACNVALASCAATYDVVASNSRPGVMPSNCLGNHVIPNVGALNKGQLYYVRVFAYNQIGFSEPKLAAAPQKPMIAPGTPTGVTLAVWTVSELVLLFNPPDDNGGDTVTGYEVQWATDTAFTTPSSIVVQLTTGMSAPYRRTISALTKGTRYFVRVRARNSQGLGQFQVSSPVSQQPYTTPSSPTQVVLGVTSATMLTVGWAPPLDDGGDSVLGYVVQWDTSPSFDSLAVSASSTAVVNDAIQRSYTITLLTPGTRYYVRVFANNLGGKGTPQTSTPASIVPATTRPGKPNSLAVTSTATTGQLQVVWQPPRVPAHGIPCAGTMQAPQSCPDFSGLDMVYGGVSLESYLVQYANAIDFSLAKEISVTTTSATVSGLDSSKTYYVRVLTVNSQGLNSDFCVRANAQSLLCPDHLVLEDGSVVTGDFVSATPK